MLVLVWLEGCEDYVKVPNNRVRTGRHHPSGAVLSREVKAQKEQAKLAFLAVTRAPVFLDASRIFDRFKIIIY